MCIAILACSFWLGDSDKTVSVLFGAKSSGCCVCGLLLPRLFTPIPQNVFEQKEWNLQLIEARILSSCLLLPLLYSVYSEARLGWRKSHFLLSFFSCLLTLSSTVFCPFFTDERKCTITLILHFLDTQY